VILEVTGLQKAFYSFERERINYRLHVGGAQDNNNPKHDYNNGILGPGNIPFLDGCYYGLN
jgi:hypothetical protein